MKEGDASEVRDRSRKRQVRRGGCCHGVAATSGTRQSRAHNEIKTQMKREKKKKIKLKWNEDKEKKKWARMTKILTTPTVKKRRSESKVGRWGGETDFVRKAMYIQRHIKKPNTEVCFINK